MAGAVVARSGLNQRLGKWGTAAGITAALFPDADYFIRFVSMEFYLRHHRGITTSIFMILPFCLLLAYIFKRLSGRGCFRDFFWISFGAFLSHIFLDAITSFGTMMLAPFSQQRFALDLVFIIDFVVTGILLAALILSYICKGRASRVCQAGLVVSLIYIGFCAVNHQQAYRLAEQFASHKGLRYTKLASLPQPLSPLRWANLIQTEGKVYQGLVDLGKGDNPPQTLPAKSFWYYLGSRYNPPSQVKYRAWDRLLPSPWVDRALATDGAKFFYWFARFPIVKRVYEEQDHHRVEFFDLRFYMFDASFPFLYVVELDQQGKLIRQGFGRE